MQDVVSEFMGQRETDPSWRLDPVVVADFPFPVGGVPTEETFDPIYIKSIDRDDGVV